MTLLINTKERVVEFAHNGEDEVQLQVSGAEAAVLMTDPAEHYDAELVAGLPVSLVRAYAAAATKHAIAAQVDGEWFTEVKGLPGVWGKAPTVEAAFRDLEDSIVSWAVLKLSKGSFVPAIEGYDLNPAHLRGQAS